MRLKATEQQNSKKHKTQIRKNTVKNKKKIAIILYVVYAVALVLIITFGSEKSFL